MGLGLSGTPLISADLHATPSSSWAAAPARAFRPSARLGQELDGFALASGDRGNSLGGQAFETTTSRLGSNLVRGFALHTATEIIPAGLDGRCPFDEPSQLVSQVPFDGATVPAGSSAPSALVQPPQICRSVLVTSPNARVREGHPRPTSARSLRASCSAALSWLRSSSASSRFNAGAPTGSMAIDRRRFSTSSGIGRSATVEE
jgi:hypothetical protein